MVSPQPSRYTAEEVAYRAMNFTLVARWSHIYASVFGVITKSGYLTEGITVSMINQTGDDGVLDHTFVAINYLPEPADPRLMSARRSRRTGLILGQIMELHATLSPGTTPVLLLILGCFGAKP